MDAKLNAGRTADNNKPPTLNQRSTNLLGFQRSPWFLLVLIAFSFTSPALAGLCPPGCQCENKGLSTVCPGGELKHVPHFLNPSIMKLKVNGNKITKLEGSLNFYKKVSKL